MSDVKVKALFAPRGFVRFMILISPQLLIFLDTSAMSLVVETKLLPDDRDSNVPEANVSHFPVGPPAGRIPAAVRSIPNSANWFNPTPTPLIPLSAAAMAPV